MQTSGLILDMNDDVGGDVLRSIYPTIQEVPELVKTAHRMDASQLEALPDDVFALVLVNDGEKLRKYACVDSGNTVLSIEYFLKTAHKLPAEACKVAAENLKVACGWYGLTPPEDLEKTAIIGAAINAGMRGLQAFQAGSEIKQNLANVRATEAQQGLGKIMTPSEISKGAEVGFTAAQSPPTADKTVDTKKAVIKVSSMSRLVRRHMADPKYPPANIPPRETNSAKLEENAQQDGHDGRQFLGRVMTPEIDVTGKEGPEKPVYEKKASVYALGGKYPLDNLVQIKRAAAYFDEYGKRMRPEERREYCINMVKSASAIGLEVSDEARKYAAAGYAPKAEIKVAMDARRSALVDEKHIQVLDNIMSKQASVGPGEFCEALRTFDEITGLNYYYDSYVPDPYWSTYGFRKTAAFTETIGNDSVTEEQLKALVSPGGGSGAAMGLLKKTFGDEFTDEFRKDPIGIFRSMPRDQKTYIMRLANDNGPSGITS